MKKHLYQLLASVSLLGTGLAAAELAQPVVVYADDFTAEKGNFIVGGSPINVRSAPSTTGAIINAYQPGQKVNYDQIGTANGYRWISYISNSGERRYVAIGTADGSASYGSLEPASSGSSRPERKTLSDFRPFAGEWVNGEGHTHVLTEDGLLDGRPVEAVQGENGVVGFVGFSEFAGGGGRWPVFIPAGVTDDKLSESDSSRDRLVHFPDVPSFGPLRASYFYYRTTKAPAPDQSAPSSSASAASSSQPAAAFTADFIKSVAFQTPNATIKPSYYALYDINGDGTQELVFGNDNNGNISVYGVYALINGNVGPVSVISDVFTITVYADGDVVTGGRSGTGATFEISRLGADKSGVDKEIRDWSFGQPGIKEGVEEVTNFDWKTVAEVDQHNLASEIDEEADTKGNRQSQRCPVKLV